MMMVALGVGIVLGWATGGSLTHLAKIRFYLWEGLIGVLVLQLMLQRYPATPLALWLFILSYIVMLGILGVNWKTPGVSLIASGVGLNALVIVLNRGMPVDGTALPADQLTRLSGGHYPFYHLVGEDTVLPVLADHIFVPFEFLGAGSLLSPGDFALMIGIVWLIVVGMRPT